MPNVMKLSEVQQNALWRSFTDAQKKLKDCSLIYAELL